MDYIICTGLRNDKQFFVWIQNRKVVNEVATEIEKDGRWNVTETINSGRWISDFMPDAGCIVVWYAEEGATIKEMDHALNKTIHKTLFPYLYGQKAQTTSN